MFSLNAAIHQAYQEERVPLPNSCSWPPPPSFSFNLHCDITNTKKNIAHVFLSLHTTTCLSKACIHHTSRRMGYVCRNWHLHKLHPKKKRKLSVRKSYCLPLFSDYTRCKWIAINFIFCCTTYDKKRSTHLQTFNMGQGLVSEQRRDHVQM